MAGLSARLMAEAAARDGFEVLALDLFGDADTRRVATGWQSIGEPAQMRLDAGLTLAALAGSSAQAWVAGSGFEAQPGLLAQGAACLPLLGTAPEDVARVRDPQAFFGFLEARDISHPPWRRERLVEGEGGPWLAKDSRGCGGGHVRRAAPGESAASEHHYFQQALEGTPMSVTFVGNGREAAVLGFNEMIVRSLRGRPFVFCGVIGPIGLPQALASRLAEIVRQLTAEFRLCGLCSLDFIRQGPAFGVLEVNARPPASMALYPSTMRAHVQACLDGHLPALPSPDGVRGTEIQFASCAGVVDAALARALAARPDAHDLPHAGMHCAAGDPVCSLSAWGASAAEVRRQLARAREALLKTLEKRS